MRLKMLTNCKCAIIAIIFAFTGCSQNNETNKQAQELAPMEYSKNLRIGNLEGESVVEIRSFIGRDTLIKRFVLRNQANIQKPLPNSLKNAQILQVPLKRVAALSSAQIGFLLRLKLEQNIVAISSPNYIADSMLSARIAAGKVASVGSGTEISLEQLAKANPDIVMSFATGGAQDDYTQIEKIGTALALTSEWQENSPLAKAEWIKFYGSLFNKQKMADSIFEQSKQNYLKLQQNTSKKCLGPRVLAGMSYGGIWYAPGGNSYTANLIKDAGGCYLWANDSSRELKFDLETIFALADIADVWVNPGMFESAEQIIASEPRCAFIKAFKQKRVYQNDNKKGALGANDFYESAVTHPAELLKNMSECINKPQKCNNKGSFEHKIFDWYHNIFIF